MSFRLTRHGLPRLPDTTEPFSRAAGATTAEAEPLLRLAARGHSSVAAALHAQATGAGQQAAPPEATTYCCYPADASLKSVCEAVLDFLRASGSSHAVFFNCFAASATPTVGSVRCNYLTPCDKQPAAKRSADLRLCVERSCDAPQLPRRWALAAPHRSQDHIAATWCPRTPLIVRPLPGRTTSRARWVAGGRRSPCA